MASLRLLYVLLAAGGLLAAWRNVTVDRINLYLCMPYRMVGLWRCLTVDEHLVQQKWP